MTIKQLKQAIADAGGDDENRQVRLLVLDSDGTATEVDTIIGVESDHPQLIVILCE